MPSIQIEHELTELFQALHASGHFADGKEISDSDLRYTPSQTLKAYNQRKLNSDFDLLAFYHQHFIRPP